MTHFPDSSVDTVNSAIFLRFINPAIVSPQSYGLVQGEIPNNVRRGLTFLSKVSLGGGGGGDPNGVSRGLALASWGRGKEEGEAASTKGYYTSQREIWRDISRAEGK